MATVPIDDDVMPVPRPPGCSSSVGRTSATGGCWASTCAFIDHTTGGADCVWAKAVAAVRASVSAPTPAIIEWTVLFEFMLLLLVVYCVYCVLFAFSTVRNSTGSLSGEGTSARPSWSSAACLISSTDAPGLKDSS